ncbi:hypothetical protein VOM14_29940 [Paraburkholderia sp. MPAMCS5]|uniref:hypothetical protein n=1 Tax=Paraburkholderia sp. MPAMCS5 TaxID=3112563 RepID=UPI002E19C632|nr:hypothetical protein [Paraburkholderia sp. MPAMCS5]
MTLAIPNATVLPCAMRIASRVTAPRLAAGFNTSLLCPASCRPHTQRDLQHMNRGEPLAAPVRPLSRTACGRVFL